MTVPFYKMSSAENPMHGENEFCVRLQIINSPEITHPKMRFIASEKAFDEGCATWFGITPDDHLRRAQERAEIQKRANL